ncbi:S-adenosyl-L-methionine-dependent methyltransferase [Pyronema omphalodes]|nr:S-adenosyl-L-methionine-dependent methyltransferase [Pyronema omphalodes]
MKLIEVDPTVLEKPENEDYDSSGYDTSTASLTSSINQYIFEDGRRYHAYFGQDKYLMPNDDQEQDRLDLHHEILRLAWDDKLYEAPLDSPQRILDIGTGTGIWAIDMAEKFPMAEVIGTDLSPIQPSWVPPNCSFQVDDAMMDWTFRDDHFDFIHARNILSGVSNWEHLVQEMLRCTTPGGYIELCELDISFYSDDGSMRSDNPAKIYIEHLRSALTKMGRPPIDLQFMKNLLLQAGFEDIVALQVKEPVGPWPRDSRMKTLGAMVLLNMETAFESYGMAAFTRVLGMEIEKARAICDEAKKATRNKNYHMYGHYFRVYGRKPAMKA